MSASTTITGLDSVTPGTSFNVGDGTNKAIRVNVVAGGGGGGGSVTGTLSTNTAAPINDNLGVLGAVANAAAPSYTEGYQVLLSTNLGGSLRVVVTGNTTVVGAGTAGTPSGGVVSVQGVAGGTPQPVSISAEYTQSSGTTFSASVGGTAVQLASHAANVGVLVTADPAGGSNYIYVGFSSGVTAGTNAATDGVKLAAGAGVIFPVSNSNAIWLIASASSQTAFIGVV